MGDTIRSFMALICALPKIENEKEKVLPFARIAVDVFQNIGDDYAESVNLILASIPPSILQGKQLGCGIKWRFG